MIARCLSYGIRNDRPTLTSIKAPSKEVVIQMLQFVKGKDNPRWDDLLDAGYSYNDCVWMMNSFIHRIGGMDPVLQAPKNIEEGVEKYYSFFVEHIDSAFN